MGRDPRCERKVVEDGGVVAGKSERLPQFFSDGEAGQLGKIFFLEKIRI